MTLFLCLFKYHVHVNFDFYGQCPIFSFFSLSFTVYFLVYQSFLNAFRFEFQLFLALSVHLKSIKLLFCLSLFSIYTLLKGSCISSKFNDIIKTKIIKKELFYQFSYPFLAFKIKYEDGVEKGLRNEFGSSKTITLDAMRPEFRLGSLYDRRTDNLLPGFTLWKEKSFRKKGFISERLASNQQWLIDSENTFSSKVWKLDIEAGLTLSLLGGLVDIKGHAKYLKDTASSSNVAKVSLTYKETTVYRELNSDALYNLDFGDLLTNEEKRNEFTHVVVGIQYGGTCTMVFEREIENSETKEEIEGALSVVLKSFPISGDAKLKLSSDVKEKVDNFKCTVYSDLKSDASVANWDEALSLYESLPTKLSASGETDAEKGVPVKIWLLPKNMLNPKHNTFVKELSSIVVNKPKDIIESLNTAINESHDLLNKTRKFPILNNKIGRFAKLVENYSIAFRKDVLSVLLVSIRSGTGDEKLLFDAVERHEHSTFGYVSTWMRRIKEEVDVLLATQTLLPVSFANKRFEQNIVEKTTSVVFTLKVCKREDKFLEEMESHYNNLARNETTTSKEKIIDILYEKKWFENESLKEKMRKMTYQMSIFASANQLNRDAGFFVREMECEGIPDCSIDVWEKGKKLTFISFEPPTEIRNLQIKEYSHNTIKIKWNIPEEGRSNISNYKIEVISVAVENEKESLELLHQIKVSPVTDETMAHVFTNLRPGKVYQVSVKCLCLNDHAASKSVTVFQMTRPSNPPVEFQGEVKEKRHIKLTWENPTIKAESADLKSFLIEYKKTNGKLLPSKSLPSDVKSYIFFNLSYATEYQFRILACYGGEKDTLPSEDINLKTEPMEVPQIEKVKIYFYLHQGQEIRNTNVFKISKKAGSLRKLELSKINGC